MDGGTIELEPEVLAWLRSLDEDAMNHVAFYIDLLAERGPLLGEPHTRQLDRPWSANHSADRVAQDQDA